MRIFGRREQTTRDYPAAATSVTGSAGRFRSHKTSGARAADRAGQAWEDGERDRDRTRGWGNQGGGLFRRRR
ncbi:hypothetical protein [Streptomyces sp. NPDC016845]|uniref:hypothetical protein n=1 Tax=Streptomyces sp. NPDC016845 TaxID=3364972 RepID=UPI00378909C8